MVLSAEIGPPVVPKNCIEKVKADGSGWVDYIWEHPTNGEQTLKTSFVIGIGKDQLIGAGVYK